MIAVGDVQLELALRITVRGTVRQLAALMELLTSSEVVVAVTREVRSKGEKPQEAPELSERFDFTGKGFRR